MVEGIIGILSSFQIISIDAKYQDCVEVLDSELLKESDACI